MKNKTIEILTLIILFSLFCSSFSIGQQEKTTEEIFFEQMETVITASKREQRIQDSPASISVITEDDIRESGARSIPDILRYIPGIDVMQTTASHWEVNARGLNQLRSNKMLVMIDNRSVYLDYYGGVIWQSLPISLEDIKRIEVIRSPISALYGANALSGIINIITKSPRESSGLKVTLEKGNLQGTSANASFGNVTGRFGYKISANWRELNSWRDNSINSEKRSIAGIKTDYIINGKSSITLDAGIESGIIDQIILSSILRFDGTTNYIKSNYNYGNFNAQFFWNRGEISSPSFVGYGDEYRSEYNTIDIEAVHNMFFGSGHTLIFGGNFRINHVDANYFDRDHRQNLFAGFLQHEYMPGKKARFLAGLRYDNHPITGNNLSPRISFHYMPAADHTFRLTASNAYRNPTSSDTYLEVPLQPVPLPSPPLPPGMETNMTILGNEDLKPENIRTIEMGYQTILGKKVKLKADLFYNIIEDFIGTGDFLPESFILDPQTGNPIINPVTGQPIPSQLTQSFVNRGKAESTGGEIEIDWLATNWMRLRANYSYQDMQNKYTLNRYEHPSRHKYNLISDFTFKNGLSASLMGHYVGKSKWDIDTNNDSMPEMHDTASYFVADARISMSFGNSPISVDFIAQNVFNNKHKEYVTGETIGRQVFLRLRFSR